MPKNKNSPSYRAHQKLWYTRTLHKFPLKKLYKRDKGICQECMEPCAREDASRGHIVPMSKGGEMSWDNLQLECMKCNSSKGDRMPGDTE